MRRLALLLLMSAAHADPVFESVTRRDAGWVISTRPAADERPVTVCQKTLYDVLYNERIHVEGWGQVDAPDELVGINMQIAYCDPLCDYTGRWPAPHVHFWAAGNVSHDEEHHKIMRPMAVYVSPAAQTSVRFELFLNVYGPLGRYAELDDCGMTFMRYR